MTNSRLNPRKVALLAGAVAESIESAGLAESVGQKSRPSPVPTNLFDVLVTNQSLRQASASLFRDGHYARAVEEAFKCLNSTVRQKSKLADRDGADLMRTALSPNGPILKLNAGSSQSEANEQRGYMDIYAGAMIGIRNPRAHDHELTDEPEAALEMIVLANHLMRKLDSTQASS